MIRRGVMQGLALAALLLTAAPIRAQHVTIQAGAAGGGGSGDALTSQPLSQFAATSCAQFAGVITGETGSCGSVVLSQAPVFGGTVSFGTASTSTGILRLLHASHAFFNDIQQSASQGASITYTLPTTDGGASEFLQTNGSGVLTWAAAGGGVTIGDTQVAYATAANTLGGSANLTFTGASLTLNNGASAVSPFVVQDNGTPVVTVADGGATTFASPASFSVGSAAAPGLHFGSATTGFWARTGNVVSVSFNGTQQNEWTAVGLQLGSAEVFGWTSATTGAGNPDVQLTREGAAILQLGSDYNGTTPQTIKAHDSITGTNVAGASLTVAGGRGTGSATGGNIILQTSPSLASGTTSQTLETRSIVVAKQFNLTDNTATTFAISTLGNDTFAGGTIQYCVYAADATTAGQECGSFDFGGQDVTAGAGGETCATPTKVGTPLQVLTGSTLTVTFAATTGTDLCNWRVTADTDIATPVNLYIKYKLAHNSGAAFAAQ